MSKYKSTLVVSPLKGIKPLKLKGKKIKTWAELDEAYLNWVDELVAPMTEQPPEQINKD